MLLKEAQLSLQKSLRRELAGGDHDPATLSSSIRELALRAHHLVRAVDARQLQRGAGPVGDRPSELESELTELLEHIVQLQKKLPAQKFGDLAMYVSALRQRVEERLA